MSKKEERKCFYLTTHSTHFIYGCIANPVPTSPLTDDIATTPSGPVLSNFHDGKQYVRLRCPVFV